MILLAADWLCPQRFWEQQATSADCPTIPGLDLFQVSGMRAVPKPEGEDVQDYVPNEVRTSLVTFGLPKRYSHLERAQVYHLQS